MSDHSRSFFIKRFIIIFAYLSIFNHLSIYIYYYKEWRLTNSYYSLGNTVIIQQNKNRNPSKLGNNIIYKKNIYIYKIILYIKNTIGRLRKKYLLDVTIQK